MKRGRERRLGEPNFAQPRAHGLLVRYLPTPTTEHRIPARPGVRQSLMMDLDDLLFRYFGTTELAQVPPNARTAGIERIQVDLGLATVRGQRFPLWALLHILGAAPDLDVGFKDLSVRDAAHTFMDLLASVGDG